MIASINGEWRYDAGGGLHRGIAVALTRGEWVTVIVWLLALTLNAVLLNEDVQRLVGLCGESRLQTPCVKE